MLVSVLLVALALDPAPTPAASPAPGARPVVALIPFGNPDKRGSYDDEATTLLADELKKNGASVVTTAVQDHASIPSSAAAICSANNATIVLAGTLKVDQTVKTSTAGKLISFLPVVGLASNTGAFKQTPTRVHFALSLLSCDGSVSWQDKDEYGDAQHNGNNAPAAVPDAIEDALPKILRSLPAAPLGLSLAPAAAPEPAATP